MDNEAVTANAEETVEISYSDIKSDAIKVAEWLLETTIKQGGLDADIIVSFEKVAVERHLKSKGLCRICFQYLEGIGCLTLDESPTKRGAIVKAKAALVDFVTAHQPPPFVPR